MLGELRVQDAVTRLVLHGELDLLTVDALRKLLADATAAPTRTVVVDVSDTAFVDVLSLAAILAAADAVRDRGGSFTVTGASRAVRRICALLNAEDLLAPSIPVPRMSLA
jgi:anti-anti-sigma factor